MDEKEKIFLSVLDSYKGVIYKVANAYCYDRSDMDDLVQEIAIRIWQSIGRFNEEYKWSTWIYRIALNTSISFYRKNKHRKEKTVRLTPVIDLPTLNENTFGDEDFLLLHTFIRELREIDRALILLHLEGLDSNEIADVIGTSQTNVTTKISRVRKKLKHKFEEHIRKEYGKH